MTMLYFHMILIPMDNILYMLSPDLKKISTNIFIIQIISLVIVHIPWAAQKYKMDPHTCRWSEQLLCKDISNDLTHLH